MKVRLITVVWGRQFADLFLRVGLRSLLAEGNVEALAHAHQVIYTIYTTPDDASRLERDPSFIKLRRVVTVHFSLFGLTEIDAANPSSHGIFWYRGLQLAQRNGEVLFFIMPDVLHARGTLLRWAQRFEAGAKAVFTIGPRVALETALQELEARFPAADEPCDLHRSELLELLYRHFHPVHAVMRRNSVRRFAHPEFDVRVVPGQGAVVREIVSHAFALDPGFFSAFRYFTPEDHLDALAFEPCSTVSVEPVTKFIHHLYRPWPLDQNRLSNLGGWWAWHATRSCERESEHAFELCYRPGHDPVSIRARARAVAGGRIFRSQILAAGRLYQLFIGLRKEGLSRAAAVLATAVFAGRLRRRLGVRRRAILLVPTDAAIDQNWSQIRELLVPGRERDLATLIADHVLLPEEEMRCSRRRRTLSTMTTEPSSHAEAQFTASGLRAEPLIGDANLAGARFDVGPFTIYPVDRVLWRERPGQPAAPDLTHAASPIVSVGAPAQSYPTRRQRSLRQAMNAAARHGVSLSVKLLRGLVSRTERMPLIGRPVRLSLLVARSIRDRGLVRTWERVVARVDLLRALDNRMVRMRRRWQSLTTMMHHLVRVARRDGPVVVTRKVIDRLRIATSRIISSLPLTAWRSASTSPPAPHDAAPAPPSIPGTADVETFDDIRRIRALQAIEQMLTEFMQGLRDEELQSSPLVFVRRLLGEVEEPGQRQLSQLLIDRLVGLTSRHPLWSEAWLELGFLYLDAEQADDALAAFERAMGGTSKVTDGIDACAVAAAHHGRILAARGRHEEACRSFSYCLRHDPSQAIAAVELAGQLRSLGDLDLAVGYYETGMDYQAARWNVPEFPRDASEVSFPSLRREREMGRRCPVELPIRPAAEPVAVAGE
jgi:hypothetical protein